MLRKDHDHNSFGGIKKNHVGNAAAIKVETLQDMYMNC